MASRSQASMPAQRAWVRWLAVFACTALAWAPHAADSFLVQSRWRVSWPQAPRADRLRQRASVSLVPQFPNKDPRHEPPLTPSQELRRIRSEIRKYNASELYDQYKSLVPLTVNILRQEYGERANWWGDLSSQQTRMLYQNLLPRMILCEDEFQDLPLKDRAYIASMARYAAKLYTRERCRVPGRVAANLYDAARYAARTGRWSWTGMTVDEIWNKYEQQIKAELGQGVSEDMLYQSLYERILSKSCSTNPFIDQLMLGPGNAARPRRESKGGEPKGEEETESPSIDQT